MAKRFADSELWQKDWFLDLSIKQKLLLKFLFDNCDCAGVYEISYRTLKTCFNEEITKKDFNGLKQVVFINDNTVYIQDFIKFQYGCEVSELNPNYSVHKGIIKKLNKYGIFETLSQGLDNCYNEQLQDKDKVKDKDNTFNTSLKEEKEKIKKEKEEILTFSEDLFFDKTIQKVFDLYKEHCKSLIPIKFEHRTRERLIEIKEFLKIVGLDFNYVTELFKKANKQKVFYNNPINLKSLIKNHDSIYSGLGASTLNEPQGSTNISKEEQYRENRVKELEKEWEEKWRQ